MWLLLVCSFHQCSIINVISFHKMIETETCIVVFDCRTHGLYMYHFEVYSSKTLHSSISRQIEIYHKLTCNIFIGHKGYDLNQCYKNSRSSHYRQLMSVRTVFQCP